MAVLVSETLSEIFANHGAATIVCMQGTGFLVESRVFRKVPADKHANIGKVQAD